MSTHPGKPTDDDQDSAAEAFSATHEPEAATQHQHEYQEQQFWRSIKDINGVRWFWVQRCACGDEVVTPDTGPFTAPEAAPTQQMADDYWIFSSASAHHDEEFAAHDFKTRFPGSLKEHPHCTRCHVPEGSSESKWDDGRCTLRTFLTVPAHVVKAAALSSSSPTQAAAPQVAVCANCLRQTALTMGVCVVCHGDVRCHIVQPSAPASSSPRTETTPDLRALVAKWRNDPITVGNDNPYFLQGNVLLNCADELEQALAAAPVSSAPTPAWQPIETAPKDGTRILAAGFNSHGKPFADEVYWSEDDYNDMGPSWRYWKWANIQPSVWSPLPALPPASEEHKS